MRPSQMNSRPLLKRYWPRYKLDKMVVRLMVHYIVCMTKILYNYKVRMVTSRVYGNNYNG